MKQYVKLLTGLFASLFFAFSVAAQASDSFADQVGISLYKKGEYRAAIPKLTSEAGSGSIDSRYHLGMAYFYGNGVLKSEVEGVAHYRMAAEAGHLGAATALGWAYERGRGGLAKNMETAVKWYRIAAEGGNQYAQFNIGLAYRNGWTGPVSHADALEWFNKAAEQGHAGATTYIGIVHELGEGVPKDEAAALAWYLKGAQRGDMFGMTNYANARYIGIGGPKSYEEALKWFSAAAQKNHARAQYKLGLMYENGHGVPADYVEARSWYKKAADQNYDGASEKFESLREKAVAQSASAAQFVNYNNLSTEELKSLCLEKDIEACQLYYEQIRAIESDSYFVAEWICDHGNIAAYCNTAAQALYSGAPPIGRDLNRAFHNYSLACEKGHAPACFQAGNMALAGDGIARDIFVAQPLFSQACGARISNSCQLADRLSGLMARGERTLDDMTVRRAMEQGQSNGGLEGCTLVRLPNYRDYYNCTERDSKRMKK